MKNIDEKVVSYIAGVIDSEGCLQIKRKIPKKNTQSIIHSFVITVNMTHRETVEFLHRTTGVGTVRTVTPKKPNHRPYYSWNVSSNQAKAVLDLIHPYMITKKKEADIVNDFFDIENSQGKRKLDREIVARRENLFWKLRNEKRVV